MGGVAARVEGWSESVERANGDGSNGANATAATASPPPARVVSTYDVTESDGRIIVSIDVPGLSREDLSVTVLDDERAVVVKGEAGRRKVDVRAVLPIKCEMRALSVRLVRGVLTIEVPVVVETEGRRVEIAGSPPRVSPGREKAAVVADCDEMSDGWTKQM
ncbi:hypothetical protein HK101_003089 [Irineochytrium annulatum]|nr:hypothetical protein HK101_003089 [Irineochytrium annulatum]